MKPQPPTSPRVGKQHLLLEDERVKLTSPTLRRALVETGVTLDELRGLGPTLIEGPQPREVLVRRRKAMEELRVEQMHRVLAVRQRYKQAAEAAAAAAKTKGADSDEEEGVAAVVAREQARMQAHLEAEMARMDRHQKQVEAEVEAAQAAAAEQHRMMLELEKRQVDKERKIQQLRARTDQERLRREADRDRAEEQARAETHAAQSYAEAYDNSFAAAWQQRQRELFDGKLGNNRKHLRRLERRMAQKKAVDSTEQQAQLEREGRSAAEIAAHVERVERRKAQLVASHRQRSEVVEAKMRAAKAQKVRSRSAPLL